MDIVERLRFDSARCEAQFSKGVASNIEAAAVEIERLRTENETFRSWIADGPDRDEVINRRLAHEQEAETT